MISAARDGEPAPPRRDEPLHGLRVAVTRPPGQAAEFARALAELGAEVKVRPLIRVQPSDTKLLRAAATQIQKYDWVVFTSVNAVGIFLDALVAVGKRPGALGGVRVAAVGPATRDALEAAAVPVDVLPGQHVSEAIATAVASAGDLAGAQVLWPRARDARVDLMRELEVRGAQVEAIEAYRTVPDAAVAAGLRAEIAAGSIDVVTLTSPSAVQTLAAAGTLPMDEVCVAVIGPVTAEAARDCGIPVHVEAAEHTTRGMLVALQEYYDRPPRRR